MEPQNDMQPQAMAAGRLLAAFPTDARRQAHAKREAGGGWFSLLLAIANIRFLNATPTEIGKGDSDLS